MSGGRWAAERAVELGRDADVCLAIADDTATVHLRWAANTLTSSGAVEGRRLTVIAVVGPGVGVVAQQGDLTDAAVARLVRTATDTARRAGPAPDAQPIVPAAKSEHWGRPSPIVSFDGFRDFLPELAGAFGRAARRRRLLYGYAEHQVRTSYLASSTGLALRHVQPTGIIDLTAKTLDHSASAWAGVSLAELAGVDPEALAERLHERLDWAARPVPLPAGRCEVLLPPAAVADLMRHVYLAASAQDAAHGHTVFSAADGGTRIGERLTDAPLSLYSDPAEPGLECAPFTIARASDAGVSVFDNGLPLGRSTWISNGVLTGLVQTRQSARAMRGALTPAVDNLVLTGPPDAPTLADLIADTRRGLLLTSLWYLREVDPRTLLLTGLTRDGVYLVEHGEVVGAVPDFRFNESPIALLNRTAEIGRTERTLPREWGDYFTRMAMPPLRITDFPVPN